MMTLIKQLSRRERVAVIMAATTLLLFVVYLIFNPLLIEKHRLASTIPLLQADLVWMQAQMQEVKKLNSIAGQLQEFGARPLTAANVEQAIRRLGMNEVLTDLRPGSKTIAISFNEVEYSALVNLLYELQHRLGASVSEALVEQAEERSGLVNASLQLYSQSD